MSQTVSDIAAALGARLEGDGAIAIRRPAEPALAGADDLALAMDAKFAESLTQGAARAAVLWDGADWQALGLRAAIFVPRPRYAMAGITAHFDPGRDAAPGIHPSAVIHPEARIGAGASIGPFVSIGRAARLGENARIMSHVSIAEGAEIGTNVQIAEGARIMSHVRIGADVIIHANAVIGSDGFSFVTPQKGKIDEFKEAGQVTGTLPQQAYVRIHSLGSVSIGDRVEIGAGSTIDKGTIRDTVIGDGTKLDNLVQIGHNVQVGQDCLLCGQVGIAGSTVIGNRAVLGGQAGVADHLSIGDDVIVAGASGVSSNIPAGRVMMGNPAIPMDINIAAYKQYRRLPRLSAKLEALQKQVSKFTSNG